MGFDLKAYKEAICNTTGCFDYSTKLDTKAAYKATAWIEGELPPKIGDTVDVYDASNPGTPKSVLLTGDNYACNLQAWVALKTFNCFDGDYSKNIWFFPNNPNGGLRNATRGMWETVLESIDDEELAWPIGVTATTKYNLDLLKNQCWYNSLVSRKPKLSIINFLDNGVEVLPYGVGKGKFETVIKKGGYALEDPKSVVSGSIEVFQRGKEAPCFHVCEDENYSETLQKIPEFTYDRKDTVVTGLLVETCGTKSACAKYTIAPNLPFTFQLKPKEVTITTCLTNRLLGDCGENLTPAIAALVTVDSDNIVTSTGLPAGEYTFTIVTENECCVSGATCFTVIVK